MAQHGLASRRLAGVGAAQPVLARPPSTYWATASWRTWLSRPATTFSVAAVRASRPATARSARLSPARAFANRSAAALARFWASAISDFDGGSAADAGDGGPMRSATTKSCRRQSSPHRAERLAAALDGRTPGYRWRDFDARNSSTP